MPSTRRDQHSNGRSYDCPQGSKNGFTGVGEDIETGSVAVIDSRANGQTAASADQQSDQRISPAPPFLFNWTLLISVRASVSWLAVALMASESDVTFCTVPLTALPPDRATRISVPGTSWIRLAQLSVTACCWAGAFPASPANNNTAMLTLLINRLCTSRPAESYHQVLRQYSLESLQTPLNCGMMTRHSLFRVPT